MPADPGAGASGRPLRDARWTRMSWAVLTHRRTRLAGSVLLSVGVLALVLWQIDVGAAVDAIAEANGLLLLAALAVSLVTTWGMAWRWQLLLTPRDLREPLGWLVRVYFVGYAAGQVLPTGLGGDALRIVEHARRRRGRTSEVTAAVVLERAIGMAGVLVMAAVGLGLAIGRYDGLGAIIVVEVVCVAIGGLAFFLVFSRRARRALRHARPTLRRLHIERPLEHLYEAMHVYRDYPRTLAGAFAVTIVLQLARTVPIWLCGEAVGLDVSPVVYLILASDALAGAARSLHAERVRCPGGVLRRVPGPLRRRRGSGVRNGVPLLHDHGRDRDPGRAHPALAQRPPGVRPRR